MTNHNQNADDLLSHNKSQLQFKIHQSTSSVCQSWSSQSFSSCEIYAIIHDDFWIEWRSRYY